MARNKATWCDTVLICGPEGIAQTTKWKWSAANRKYMKAWGALSTKCNDFLERHQFEKYLDKKQIYNWLLNRKYIMEMGETEIISVWYRWH